MRCVIVTDWDLLKRKKLVEVYKTKKVLISKTAIDSYITQNEFILANNVLIMYEDMNVLNSSSKF